MFNIGDFVYNSMYGYGVIISQANQSIGVFFNKRQYMLHKLDGKCPDGHGWWCIPYELSLVDFNQKAEEFVCNICGKNENVKFNGECFICDSCENKPITCVHCGKRMAYKEYARSQNSTSENDPICDECITILYDRCDHCSMYFRQNGDTHCPECRAAERVCTSCSNIFYDRETDSELCFGCRRYCGRCNCLLRESEYEIISGDVYCRSCYDVVMSRCGENLMQPPEKYKYPYGICDYGYNPESMYVYPDSSHSKDVLMGIELEVDGGATDNIACEVNDILGYTYVKHDGSLDDGMEIVTFPATPEFHYVEKRDDWITAMKYMRDIGLRSHDAGTCGLHIHVSSVPLAAYKSDVVEKLMFLWDKHWDNLLKFSRRTDSQCSRWAARYSMKDVDLSSEDMMARSSKKLRIKACGDRYQSINLQNTFTVEFRMFRGTLNYTTFFATIQLLQHLIHQAVTHTFKELDSMSWEELVKSEYEDLNKYLDTRGLKSGLSPHDSITCGHVDDCTESEGGQTYDVANGVVDTIISFRNSTQYVGHYADCIRDIRNILQQN